MTVKELRERLASFGDDEPVRVNIGVSTQAYGVAQPTPWEVNHGYGACTLEVALPDCMYVSRRKIKSAGTPLVTQEP